MTERSLESYLHDLDVHVGLDDLHARDDLDDVDVHVGLEITSCDRALRYLETRCLNGCLIDCLAKQLLR